MSCPGFLLQDARVLHARWETARPPYDHQVTAMRPAPRPSSDLVVCGGIPAGFGPRLYASPAAAEKFRHPDDIGSRWPVTPPWLRSAAHLRLKGRRPANLFKPDGYQFDDPRPMGPAPRWFSGPSKCWSVTPVVPLYTDGEAVPLASEPSAEQKAQDRRAASQWAAEVLDDKTTLIMSVATIGPPVRQTDDPLSAVATCEITLTDTTGSLAWHQVVDPQWFAPPTSELAEVGLTAAAVCAAPPFKTIMEEFSTRTSGKRLVVHGRSHAYSALFRSYEYAIEGGHAEDGWVFIDHLDIAETLGNARWECAQLRAAEYTGTWNHIGGHYAVPLLPASAVDGPSRSRALSDLLQRLAAPSRYRELNDIATAATASGRSHRPKALKGTRLSRSAAARHAVLHRSGGACENPDCPNPHYTSDRSRSGAYLLEVDHIDDHAKGGADVPQAMAALCPNCHKIKTLGTTGEQLRERLRQTADERHRQILE